MSTGFTVDAGLSERRIRGVCGFSVPQFLRILHFHTSPLSRRDYERGEDRRARSPDFYKPLRKATSPP